MTTYYWHFQAYVEHGFSDEAASELADIEVANERSMR